MEDVWSRRFELIRAFGWVALVGLVFGVVAFISSEGVRLWTSVFCALLILPSVAYTFVVIIWHWKGRYRGKHSDLWGALIVIETSGWFKIVYLFRHLIPDMRQSGRYAQPPLDPPPQAFGTADFPYPQS